LELERKYRPDIDGLRTLAVGAVVLFHLKLSGFEGGYAGVDIFFVISGYLITGHILTDLAQRRFSFAEFYARRARRILPALITTIMLTFVAGAFWLPPEFLRQLAKEATHGLLSISNIQYWREAKQYFAPTSEQLGLLHLWSLSLEEQFYLVNPLFLVLLSRTRHIVSGIAIVGLASLIAAVAWLPRDPDALFFLMPFRVFEFAIGALAIPLQLRLAAWSGGSRVVIVSAGYFVLIGSIYALGPFQQDAGLGALPPCLATAAVIAANYPVRLLTNSFVLGVGRASYSLYLVHWPVIFFARFIFGDSAETPVGFTAQLAVMGALTALIHVAIEQPLRWLQAPRWQQGVGFATAVLAGAVITHATFKADGVRWRLPAAQLARLDLQSFGMNGCVRTGERSCAFGDLNGKESLELLGDSYVQQYVAALDDQLRARGIRGNTSTVGGCPMLIGVVLPGSRAKECADLRDSELARIKASPAGFVVIGQAWHIYLDRIDGIDERTQSKIMQDGLSATMRFLDRPGRRFLVIGGQVRPVSCAFDQMRMQPGPLWHAPPPACEPVPKQKAVAAASATDAMLAAALQPYASAELLQPTEVYCDQDCPVLSDGVWLFMDPGHFTVAGSQRMGREAHAVIDRFLSGSE
jgi:peptidoglycan/LPS O-acetylase OafA/YrhL